MRALFILPLLGCLSAISCAEDTSLRGRVLYVEPAADGELDDILPAAAPLFTSIQSAIDAASSGDTVSVPSGTYVETLTMRSGISVIGAGQGETWLVGSVTFSGLTGASLSRLSMMDPGYVATSTRYGTDGILVSSGSATIDDVGLYYYRYGLYANGSTSLVANDLTVAGNWYGVLAESTSVLLLTNSLVANNPAAGVATVTGVNGGIYHNTFVGNGFAGTSLYLTGAVALGALGSERVANNIFTSNYYGLGCYLCTSDWDHNLVWGNTTNYVSDASADVTDLSTDPRFANPGEGDYHLVAGSPAIDAGSGSVGILSDSDRELRPQGAGYDLGIDEYTISGFDLAITEVMANARTESTGEFVEILNLGASSIDLAGLVLTDGDDIDTLVAWAGGSTLLPAGARAVVVDSEYISGYTIDPTAVVLTTGDTNIGNGLTTSDQLTLYESDGSTIISTFSYPKDPGDGISLEMVEVESGDVAGNWRVSACASGSSPGAEDCFAESGDPSGLILTEVMANPEVEATGEYVEIYNPTETEIDLSGLILRDTSGSTDTLQAYLGGSTLIGPHEHALVIDAGYTYDYYLPADILLVTTGDASLGNGFSTTDAVYLYLSDGTTLIDSYTSGSDPGNGFSREKVDYTAGDVSTNWVDADTVCGRGSSPGRLNGSMGGICAPLFITEVMANADNEDRGEYVEIFNAGTVDVELAGLVITDGDEDDTIAAFAGGTTVIAAGGYALVVDAEYDGIYGVPSGVTVVTTTDTEIGNGLSVTDEIMLLESDGIHPIDTFLYPTNPGNAVSSERVAFAGVFDTAENWVACTCAAGHSAGLSNCASSSSGGATISDWAGLLVISEVMANPIDESTGEFIEIYNNSSSPVDLLRFVLYDGDAADTLFGFSDPYDTVLDPGQYAVILDAGYTSGYTLPSGTLLLTTDDAGLGSGLATNDPIYLFEADALALIDSYTFPFDPGNGVSAERVDLGAGDTSTNWDSSSCSGGSSPGQTSCF